MDSGQADDTLCVRTAWISDLHLGTPGCQAQALLEFLRTTDCQTLYLVGDIIDGWQLRRSWYWPQSHNDVVQKILRKARKGTRVIFVPGNHDEFARRYVAHNFGGVDIVEDCVHVTADGTPPVGDPRRPLRRRHPVRQVARLRWRHRLRVHAEGQSALQRGPGAARPAVLESVPIPQVKVKRAVSYVGDFEAALARETRSRGLDGVVCGHIHHAEIRDIDGVLYCNDGDWVESLTALVEHHDGRLEIIDRSAEARPVAVTVPRSEPVLLPGPATVTAVTCVDIVPRS